jgi:hypothetical protein
MQQKTKIIHVRSELEAVKFEIFTKKFEYILYRDESLTPWFCNVIGSWWGSVEYGIKVKYNFQKIKYPYVSESGCDDALVYENFEHWDENESSSYWTNFHCNCDV